MPAGKCDEEVMLLERLAAAERTAYILGRPVPVLKRIVRQPFTWADAAPGRSFLPLEYTVTRSTVEYFARLNASILGAAVTEEEVVPLPFFADEPMQCIGTQFAQAGRLHVGHKLEGLQAVPVGSTVRSRAAVVDRYEKSGHQFVQVECIVHVLGAAEETPAVRITSTLIL